MYGIPTKHELLFFKEKTLIGYKVMEYNYILNFSNGVEINIYGSPSKKNMPNIFGENPLNKLLHIKIEDIKVDGKKLTLIFSNGYRYVLYDDDEHYESFTISTSEGTFII